jgi:hypothetical protein
VGLTIEKLQKVGAGSFTKAELTAKEGEKVDYEIVVKNTGGVSLTLSNFADSGCTNLAGGASTLAAGASTTWTCEHGLTAAGKYSNTASVEANEGIGKKESNTVTVKAEPLPKGACDPSSSLAAAVFSTNVVTYIPLGHWDSGTTGISVANAEGSAVTPTTIATSEAVNSCASNSETGVTVCTGNGASVYIIKGTAIVRTLTSAGSGIINFSGGSCTNCGVAMDSVHNRALVTLSVEEGKPAYQFLNLETDTFEPPFKAASGEVSEDPLVDPTRELLLSPNESDSYELVNVAKPSEPAFFDNGPIAAGGEFDSAGEDCSTGIALATAEGSSPSNLYLADLTQAKFTPGTPGTWTAASKVQTLEESSLSAGSSGVAIAQGTHTGIVAGEFSGDEITAVSMPTSSGSGTPELRDWVSCNIGHGFSQGFDPHTVTAYQSPNGGDAIALIENETGSVVARVDLTKMLDKTTVPRTPGGHACATRPLPGTVESFPVGTAPSFVGDSPPAAATVGTTYSYTFTASGDPTPEFSLGSGELPPGLKLNAATGELSGEPTTTGTYDFTIKAGNGVSPEALTPTLTITVNP